MIMNSEILFMQSFRKKQFQSLKIRRLNKNRSQNNSEIDAIEITKEQKPSVKTFDVGIMKRNIFYNGDSNNYNRQPQNNRYGRQLEQQITNPQLKSMKASRFSKRSNRGASIANSTSEYILKNNLSLKFQKIQSSHQLQCTQKNKKQIMLSIDKLKQSTKQKLKITTYCQYLPKIQAIKLPQNAEGIRMFFISPIQPLDRYICFVKVIKFSTGNTFLLYSDQLKLLISAESQPGLLGCNYHFFIGEPRTKKDGAYLGKLGSNFTKTLFTLYGRGLSIDQTDNISERRSLLANVIHSSSDGIQQTNILIPRSDINERFLKTKIQNLQQLGQKFPRSIIKIKNNARSQIKNCIDNQSQNNQNVSKIKMPIIHRNQRTTTFQSEEFKQALIIKKTQNNLYEITVGAPLNFLQAFTVLISTFKNQENL